MQIVQRSYRQRRPRQPDRPRNSRNLRLESIALRSTSFSKSIAACDRMRMAAQFVQRLEAGSVGALEQLRNLNLSEVVVALYGSVFESRREPSVRMNASPSPCRTRVWGGGAFCIRVLSWSGCYRELIGVGPRLGSLAWGMRKGEKRN